MTRRAPWWPALVLLIAVACAILAGCGLTGRQVQAQAATAIAQAANATLPILVERFRQQGLRAIDKADTENKARAELARIDSEWAPIWKAWATLRVAQDAWATALEKGGDTAAALGALREAYCGLEAVWPKDIPAIPLGPVACGKKEIFGER